MFTPEFRIYLRCLRRHADALPTLRNSSNSTKKREKRKIMQLPGLKKKGIAPSETSATRKKENIVNKATNSAPDPHFNIGVIEILNPTDRSTNKLSRTRSLKSNRIVSLCVGKGLRARA